MQKKRINVDYIVDYIIWLAVFMIWYRNLWFKSLPTIETYQSKLVLWTLVLILGGIVSILTYRHVHNLISIGCSLIIPFFIYTSAAYPEYMLTYLILVALTILSVTTFIIRRYIILQKKSFSRASHLFAPYHICSIISIMAICALAAVYIDEKYDHIIQKTILSKTIEASLENETIANNIDMILMLQEDIWSNLSMPEKQCILQTVANIEANYLGLPCTNKVITDDLGLNQLGCYYDSTHTIRIDKTFLSNCSGEEALQVVCHESFHSYEYRLIEAYNEATSEKKNLYLFRNVEQYKTELSHYSLSRINYETYIDLTCEHDAREYAKSAAADYYQRIKSNNDDI